MTTQPSAWYIRGEDNQPIGPFTAEQLLQSLRAEQVNAGTVCWREGMPQWLSLGDVEPFAAALRRPAHRAGAPGPPDPAGPPAIRGSMPPPRHGAGIMLGRYFPAIAGCIAAGVVFVMVLVGAALMRGKEAGDAPSRGSRAATSKEQAPLAAIVRDFAARRNDAYGPQHTKVQSEALLSAAAQQLQEDLSACGAFTFTGTVEEISQASSFGGTRGNTWKIEMSTPKELADMVRKGICSVHTTLFVEMDKSDALSIRKGAPVVLRGPASYRAGAPFMMVHGSYAVISVKRPKGAFDDLETALFTGDHQFTLRISQDATCSLGALESVRVVGHDKD